MNATILKLKPAKAVLRCPDHRCNHLLVKHRQYGCIHVGCPCLRNRKGVKP